jgi:simple sugar transport system ATP-binding protein
VAEQPSRGVDIGAAESIYAQLMQLRARGVAILLISMDLTETLRLADRVLVIYGGQIVGERRPEATSPRELGRLMTGAVSNGAA